MKTIFCILFIMTSVCTVSAQINVTDREFEGLKGNVKTVQTEYLKSDKSKEQSQKKKRIVESKDFYDKNGRLTEILYLAYNNKLIFNIIDGNKTFKSYELRKETRFGSVRMGSVSEEKPIEEPENIVEPDERFDEKYKYEYDSSGRIKTERIYGNNGKLYHLRTYKYNDQGLVIEENDNDTGAVSKFVYGYDKKGNLIEKLGNRDIKIGGTDSKSRTVYSDYKLDANGNWIQRKSVYEYSEADGGNPFISTILHFRTIIYYKNN